MGNIVKYYVRSNTGQCYGPATADMLYAKRLLIQAKSAYPNQNWRICQ